jgi:hypothetical protein
VPIFYLGTPFLGCEIPLVHEELALFVLVIAMASLVGLWFSLWFVDHAADLGFCSGWGWLYGIRWRV